jgi:hypothetical protein
MNILFIQVEFNHFAPSLPWTYWCHVGMAKALTDAGHRVDVVFTFQTRKLQELSFEGNYDLAILNDVVHGFSSTDAACFRTPMASITRLRERKVPVLGVVIETIFHGIEEQVHDVLHQVRRLAIEQAVQWLDFVVAYDRFDIQVLRSAGVNALWTPFFSESPPGHPLPDKPSNELIFYGAMYEKRKQFLIDTGTERILRGGYINYPETYTQIFEKLLFTLRLPETSVLESFELTRLFKESVFQVYARHLRSQRLIVNLPSIFKGVACRVVESVAMCRPSLCPLPRHPDERALLMQIPRRACVLYDENKPELFASLLREASQIELDDGERAALSKHFQHSPFSPARFARHLTEFTGGTRAAPAIEAGYLD